MNRTYDSAQSKDGDRSTWFDLARVENGTKTSRHTTTKQANFFECSLFWYFGTRNLGQYCVLGHGGTTHEMVNWFPVSILETNCPIRHDTFVLCRTDFRTQVGLGGHAKDAFGLSALWSVARNYVITRLDCLNP